MRALHAPGKTPLKYPIRTVAKMTGLGIDTLRAWERRYAAVRPTRDERGRMYSDADVQRLRLLRDAVANGHSVGHIAALSDEQLRVAAMPRRDALALSNTAAATPASTLDATAIVDALEQFDSRSIETGLGRAAALLGPRALLQMVVMPALHQIGERWSEGRATVAHEHLLSALVRDLLGTLLRTYRRTDTPARIIFATPSGELHELGTLGAATLAASGGLGVTYLGPNLPADQIVSLAREFDTDAVVLGVTAASGMEDIEPSVSAIATALPRDVELWLGGAAAARLGESLHPRVTALPNYDDLADHLERLGARF